jgi:hypothetical protein
MTEGSGADGTGPPIRLFAYSPSRSAQTALDLYAGAPAGGVLMSDGYDPYDNVAEANKLVHLGCWAHCRRRFHEAVEALAKEKRGPDQVAVQFMDLIGRLYHVESVARKEELSASALTQRRQQHSVPILDEIERLLLAKLHTVMPKSLLGKALHYAHGQWSKLRRYVDDGNYTIDNNVCENAIRPFVVGRKAWLFTDTVAGANASANLYSLLQTCIANGIDSYWYLRRLLTELPKATTADDYEALLPWNLRPTTK